MKKIVYLDHSATTPVNPTVIKKMNPYFYEIYGNPSSPHQLGRSAKLAIENSRSHFSYLINAKPEEICFVSGGTEADNLAIKGYAFFNRSKGNHIITSVVEHSAVLNTCRFLEKQGFEVTYLPVDQYGQVDPDSVRKNIKPSTILISIIHANNEIGTINPIKEIGTIAKDKNIIFHTDAVQSFGKIPINVEELNVSLLSISGHKIYGPKGIGVLFIRKGIKIEKLFHGGPHENNRRPGTENVPGIVGIAEAAQIMHNTMKESETKIKSLRDYFQDELLYRFKNIRINGHPTNRLYNNLNISFNGLDSEILLLYLDKHGIAASSGSACHASNLEPSHVIMALGQSYQKAKSAVRFTLGVENTKDEIEFVLNILELFFSKNKQSW